MSVRVGEYQVLRRGSEIVLRHDADDDVVMDAVTARTIAMVIIGMTEPR